MGCPLLAPSGHLRPVLECPRGKADVVQAGGVGEAIEELRHYGK
jgi:hypothetical protein